MLFRITLLFSLVSTGSCLALMPQKQNPCEVSGNAWIPYTGYKIQREISFIPPPGKSLLSSILSFKPRYDTVSHVVLTKCDRGHVKYEAATKIDSGFESTFSAAELARHMWNTTICTAMIHELSGLKNGKGEASGLADLGFSWSQPDCFRIARRLKYMQEPNDARMLVPGTIVGALFQCFQNPYEHLYVPDYSPQCTPQNMAPVLPLITDKVYHAWSKLDGHPKQGGGFTLRIPLFFTPDIMHKQYPSVKAEWRPHPGTTKTFRVPLYSHSQKMETSWASHIDPFEVYQFSE